MVFSVCRRFGIGTKVIFPPKTGNVTAYMMSVSQVLEIPLINVHDTITSGLADSQGISVNLFPHYLAVSRAHRDLIKFWKWRTFTMMYEDNDGEIYTYEYKHLLICNI